VGATAGAEPIAFGVRRVALGAIRPTGQTGQCSQRAAELGLGACLGSTAYGLPTTRQGTAWVKQQVTCGHAKGPAHAARLAKGASTS
jgi:hypothetical protein